jgi:glycosyltransferase involved in cell wall biosynthesis
MAVATSDGLRLSVAMAVYNGARYLTEQLDSIARQSRTPDELVISDNHSTDGTTKIVEAFASSAPFPVRLYVNEANLGIGKNFEQAIRLCSGEVICLSDCDDVWYANKLQRIEEVFSAAPSVGIVFSDADLVRQDLTATGYRLWRSTPVRSQESTEILKKGRTALGALLRWRPAWCGNTMAFRARLNSLILPMPDQRLMWGGNHDAWIALLAVCVTDAGCIPDPLLAYRRHSAQESAGHDKLPPLLRLKRAGRPLVQVVPPGLERFICDRLNSLPEASSYKECILEIQDWARHLSTRVDLPPRRLSRLPSITRELITGRYHRFSNGIVSAVRDIYSAGENTH